MLQLQLLPARQGDALWVRWGRGCLTHQMLVDMGTESVGRSVRKRILALPMIQREFELLVVTHVDGDHIGGMLTCLTHAEPIEGLRFKDVWFNGWRHLVNVPPSGQRTEVMGPAQGERFSAWLRERPWNAAFSGRRICRDSAAPSVTLAGGLEIKVLGPPSRRLEELKPVWREEVELALAKGRLDLAAADPALADHVESLGRRREPEQPTLPAATDLVALAKGAVGGDTSEANGSSISLLVSHGDARVLLTGDAYAEDVLDGLRSIDGRLPIRVAAFKMPHHGSRQNATPELIDAVECPLFLFSTDGSQFYHPDAATVACVVRAARIRPAGLGFNVRSRFTEWWANETWCRSFDYAAAYGDPADGFVVTLPEP